MAMARSMVSLRSDDVLASGREIPARGYGARRVSCVVALLLATVGSYPDATTGQAVESDVWSYDAEGRRDPFVSLLSRGGDLRPPRDRPAGLAGVSVNELTLRGLVSLGRENLAVFEAPDKKTYILRGGERLYDGAVKSVTSDGVVFLAEVSDPLSLVSEREVRRTLGGSEGGR
jgi:Tfp pilus assembly protein PilP